MGNWAINIQGIGCHHNENPDIDANFAAAELVERLLKMGQHIEKATFTYGAKEELTPHITISVVEPNLSRSG